MAAFIVLISLGCDGRCEIGGICIYGCIFIITVGHCGIMVEFVIIMEYGRIMLGVCWDLVG